jgi:hypothetical protein
MCVSTRFSPKRDSFGPELVVARIIRTQQNCCLLGAETRMGNDASKKNKRGHGVGERVVPAKARKRVAEVIFEPEIQDKVAQGEGFLSRPDGAGKL